MATIKKVTQAGAFSDETIKIVNDNFTALNTQVGSNTDVSDLQTAQSGVSTLLGLNADASVVNGSVVAIAKNPTATSGRWNTLKVESYLNPASKTAAGGLYSVRGLAGVATGKTLAPAGNTYLAGVQGKLDPAGAIGDGTGGQIYATAVLAQVNNGAGSFGSETQVKALWVDNQFMGTPAGLFHLVDITNNGGGVTNVIHVYGNNALTRVFHFETMGGAVVDASGVTTIGKALKCKLDGTDYYIPLCTGTT